MMMGGGYFRFAVCVETSDKEEVNQICVTRLRIENYDGQPVAEK